MTETLLPAAALAEETRGIARSASVIALGNVASRVLGLVREQVMAGLFGAGAHVDALTLAITVPVQIYDLVTGGLVNSALVPVFSEYTSDERRAELWRLASILLTVAAVAVTTFVGLLLLFTPQVVAVFAALGQGRNPDAMAQAEPLLRLTLPAVLFLSLSGIFSGLLYALKRFAFPAFTAAVFNASMVAVSLLLARWLGVGAMALGLLVGAVLQVALQLAGLRDGLPALRPLLTWRHPGLHSIFKLYVPIILGLIIAQAAVYFGLGLAGGFVGGLSWMRYATTLYQFPLGLVATAVSFAILPTLSQQAGRPNGDFKATLVQGINLVTLLIVPATVGLFVLARPIVALVLERGRFTPQDTAMTALVLQTFLLGLSFAAVDQMLIFAFYARQDTLTPALVGVFSVFVYIAAALLLLDPLGLFSLMIADSVKQITHALVTGFLLSRRLGGFKRTGLWSTLGKVALASLVMAGLAWVTLLGVRGLAIPRGLVGRLCAVVLPSAVGVVAYFWLAARLGVGEVRLAVSLVRRRLSYPAGSGEYNQPVADQRSLPPDLYTKEYFLHACEGYEEFSETQGERLSRRLSAAFAVAAVTPGMKVLDVGCGRGEILRHCGRLGADAYGIDYAPAALAMARQVVAGERGAPGQSGVAQADAKRLPFPNGFFDRVLIFDVVEHLFPWELDHCLAEVRRVLRSPDPASGKPGGAVIVHTAPNVWYDRYAYPVVRLVRVLMGQGSRYPKNPRALNVAANVEVHVNEQSLLSLWRSLRRAGFHSVKAWLDSPPQNRDENAMLAAARWVLFEVPPFRYFFEREVFGVGEK